MQQDALLLETRDWYKDGELLDLRSQEIFSTQLDPTTQ
jgi:hypothetical protein